MTISKVFKSTIPSCSYIFKDGTSLEFVGGKATTDAEYQVQELMDEVKFIGKHKSKHPFIHVDEDEQEVDSEALSPLEELKIKMRKELEEEIRRSMNNGSSESSQTGFSASISNTQNNIPVGDSNSGAILAPAPSGSVPAGVQAILAAKKS